jgi:hypothetical protein
MRVELGIEFPACVMCVGSDGPVSGHSIFLQASQANPSCSVFFRLMQSFANSGFVRGSQSLVAAYDCHDRDGLWCRESHVIERPCLALLSSIGGDAIRALALPQEFAGCRIETLS